MYNTFTEAQPLLLHSKEFDDTFSVFFEDLFSKFEGPDYWEPFPETKDVLQVRIPSEYYFSSVIFTPMQDIKRRGIRMGVISNFDERLVRPLNRVQLLFLTDPHSRRY